MTIIMRDGPEWLVHCPRCHRPKLAIHVGRKAYQCWGGACRFSGWSPAGLVATVLAVPPSRAREVIAAFGLGVELGPVRELNRTAIARSPVVMPAAALPLVDWRLHPPQYDYIHGRGVSDDHIHWFGLGTIVSNRTGSKADKLLTSRVIFPVWSSTSGRIVWWVARDIFGRSKAKTLNMPQACRENHGPHCTCYHEEWGLPPVPGVATADDVVLGLHLVLPGSIVVVVEGPIDAAVCGPGFVSVQGTRISPQQAMLIRGAGPKEAIILFDGDRPDEKGRRAGEEGLAKSLPILGAALPARGITCPEGSDPGSLGRSAALEVAMSAQGGGIQQLGSRRYMSIPQPQRRRPLLDPLENPTK